MAIQQATPALPRTLGLGGGLALAIGSVAGSGILFLPSVTYSLAGRNVLVVWLVATLLCVPLLLVFGELVRDVPDGSGIEGFVARGLGRHAAAAVPLLFLSILYAGLPAAALVAGGYLESSTGGGRPVRLAGALLVVAAATAANLVGVRAGAHVQAATTWTLLVAALALFALTVPHARGGYGAVSPTAGHVGSTLGAVVVAFWAYAGFENMTFVAGELRRPRRDYLLSTLAALAAYGALGVLLTANVAAIVPRDDVDRLVGLAQLADTIGGAGIVLTVLAVLLVQANAASWLWGISRLLFAAARDRRLPPWFAALDGRGLPRRAVLALALPGAALTVVASIFPGLVLPLVAAVSAIFMFLYLLALLSYLRTRRPRGRRVGAAVLAAVMAALLGASGWYCLYPLAVAALAAGVSAARARS